MLRSHCVASNDIDTTTACFKQLSISFDNKVLRHRLTASSKPKLKRLAKSSASPVTAYCSRCKKETEVFGEKKWAPEKEVEVNKDTSVPRKVHFLSPNPEEYEKQAQSLPFKGLEKTLPVACCENEGTPVSTGMIISHHHEPISESVPVHSQSVFLAQRPSIIGNNEFWLPQCSFDAKRDEGAIGHSMPKCELEPVDGINSSNNGQNESPLEAEVAIFFDTVFRHSSRRQAKILQVVTTLDSTLMVLTEDYVFQCRKDGSLFSVLEAIALKDIVKIIVNDSCSLLVLAICRAPSLTEFKEFVPGHSEKTESLISLMVYALSRINKFLPDVTRLPLLSLPTSQAMQAWFATLGEEILFCGLATAEKVVNCAKLSEETFMMRSQEDSQFHPVLLFLRTGWATTVCNGGCEAGLCKYSVSLELNTATVVDRNDNPWPNCVRIITGCANVTLSSSTTSVADDLSEKLHVCTQTTNVNSEKFFVHTFVTEFSLQLFKIPEKILMFGSPLLNLEISDHDKHPMACIIDSQGTEVDDEAVDQLHHSWQLSFLNENEKRNFMGKAIL